VIGISREEPGALWAIPRGSIPLYVISHVFVAHGTDNGNIIIVIKFLVDENVNYCINIKQQ
jgi:hypothetical protein